MGMCMSMMIAQLFYIQYHKSKYYKRNRNPDGFVYVDFRPNMKAKDKFNGVGVKYDFFFMVYFKLLLRDGDKNRKRKEIETKIEMETKIVNVL